MGQLQILRVVVASPNDVLAERQAINVVAAELNQGIAEDYDQHIVISRWETDAYPSFHTEGPQGVIDSVLRFEDCDLLIGIFWKRFGTPTPDAKSGTEHEFRKAYEAWQRNRRPQIMIYFNQKPYAPQSKAETDQWGQVLEFKREFPKEGLWWPYKGNAQFERLVRLHLTQFIRRSYARPQKSYNNSTNTAIITPTRIGPPIDEQIAQWMQDKASDSRETNSAYKRYITQFRNVLHEHGLDLDSEDVAAVSSLIQSWANTAVRKTSIKPRTYNQRVSSISSFYNFALTKEWIKINPIEKAERREEPTADAAKPLAREKVKNALHAIPRDTLNGKRDYAILCILLTTGGRVAEIANLRCGHIAKTENSITITTRPKGGGKRSYTLKKYTAQALINYLTAINYNECSPDAPIWLSFARNGAKGFAIGKQALSDICKKRLGTSKVDATRLTYFAIKNEYGDIGLEHIETLLGINVEEDELY
jgi:site-specific recombinase XerD